MREESAVSNILLVDDNPANLLALEAVLEPLGQRLVKAQSGEEALRHLLREPFALVLLDVQMPGLDGFETARLIRQRAHHQRLPILFITAVSRDEAHVRRGYEHGAVDYILKPFDPDILRTKVSTFVGMYGRTQQRVHDQLLFQASILDNVQESIIVTDCAHRIVYWNRGATALFGYAAEEMLGQTPALLYPEQDFQAAAQDMERILEGHDYAGEWRGRRKDGTSIWVEVKTRPMRDGNGQLAGLIGVAKDISATRLLFREAQQSLRQAETDKRIAETFARLGLAFASELDREKLLQLITDEATGLTGAAFGAFFHQLDNEQGESYLLYTLSGVPREAFAGFPMPRNTAVFGPTFEGKATVRMDDVTQSPHYGKNHPYRGMPEGHLPVRSYLAIPVKSRSGLVLGGLFFGHPEPGRFREEHERLAEGLAAQAAVALDNSLLYQQAQLAVSLRDEFLQVAAHELRTPTTSLKLNVQSLLRTADGLGAALSVEKLRDKLAHLDRLTGRLSGLIDTLLDIARVTAGSLQLDWEDVDLAQVAREVASRFEAQAVLMRAPVRLTASAPVVGRWDRLRLEQVITNLLSNALKYGAGKPVHLTVSVTAPHALLVVRDEGIGISREALSRLFGRFERAVSQRHYGGLGLGLYITRQVVEALGGTIHVQSELGQGATFTVQLPMAAMPMAPLEQEPS